MNDYDWREPVLGQKRKVSEFQDSLDVLLKLPSESIIDRLVKSHKIMEHEQTIKEIIEGLAKHYSKMERLSETKTGSYRCIICNRSINAKSSHKEGCPVKNLKELIKKYLGRINGIFK